MNQLFRKQSNALILFRNAIFLLFPMTRKLFLKRHNSKEFIHCFDLQDARMMCLCFSLSFRQFVALNNFVMAVRALGFHVCFVYKRFKWLMWSDKNSQKCMCVCVLFTATMVNGISCCWFGNSKDVVVYLYLGKIQ